MGSVLKSGLFGFMYSYRPEINSFVSVSTVGSSMSAPGQPPGVKDACVTQSIITTKTS
ncbi:MAG: hypothetical protein ACHQ1H_05335 [Nitrososphaerales archaeon]